MVISRDYRVSFLFDLLYSHSRHNGPNHLLARSFANLAKVSRARFKRRWAGERYETVRFAALPRGAQLMDERGVG